MAFEQEIKVFQFHLTLGEGLISGIDPAQVATAACEGGQHPAWVIGHLGFVANQLVGMLGGTPKTDMDAWKPLFGGGTELLTDASAYPAWDELVSTWKQGHADVAAAAAGVTDELLSQPCPVEMLRGGLPTMHDFLSFVLTTHEGFHLGQLSAWRRSNGMPRLF